MSTPRAEPSTPIWPPSSCCRWAAAARPSADYCLSLLRCRQVFEPFFRARGTDRGADAGSGLGLAIARRLVEAQGVTIAIESRPGRGTTVTVTLPGAVS